MEDNKRRKGDGIEVGPQAVYALMELLRESDPGIVEEWLSKKTEVKLPAPGGAG